MKAAVVELLGAVRGRTEGGTIIGVPSASQRRLLAVLALNTGATIRTEQLCDLLGISGGALRTTVSRLRSRLGEDAIRTDPIGYCLDCTVDAKQFTELLATLAEQPDRLGTLDEALALWNGGALDEFRHEHWAEAEVTRLEELRTAAIDDRAELLLARGRGSEAVAALESQIAVHPLRDRTRGLLIAALATEGRQADALRTYQDYRRQLADETGTVPSAHVQSLERRVAAGWHNDDGSEKPEAGAAPAASIRSDIDLPLRRVLTRGTALIGRRPELGLLNDALGAARDGSLQAVLLGGEAGMGKTTLVSAFARAVHDGGIGSVVYARCDQAAVPLQPFRTIVGSLVDDVPLALLEAHCERFGGELSRIAPHLSTRLWAPPPLTSDDATERYQLFEAIADLMRRVATSDRPFVLIVDDMHWAEPTALLMLRHLGRALVDVPVLLVVSYRNTGDVQSTALQSALADLDQAGARRIVLAGFDDRELQELVVSVVDPANTSHGAVQTELLEQTAGNPLYATQLVRHLVESGYVDVDEGSIRFNAPPEGNVIPPSLIDIVGSRVRALGDVTVEVLRAGSVLGTEIDADVLVDMTERAGDDVRTALDAAVGAGLLLAAGDDPTLRFTHALVCHALYSGVRGTQRRQLHHRAAMALSKRSGRPAPHVVVQLARHWAHAGVPTEAQRWATEAGDNALGRLAPSEAATWFRTALGHAALAGRSESERAHLMMRLGEAEHRAGDPSARESLHRAGVMARSSGADMVLIRATLANDRGFGRPGLVDDEQLSMIEASIAACGKGHDDLLARLLALRAQELVHTPRADQSRVSAMGAIDLIERTGDDILLARVISPLFMALWGPDTLALRKRLAERAIEAAGVVDDPSLRFFAHRAGYFASIESADVQLHSRTLAGLQAITDQVGEPRLRYLRTAIDAFELMMHARLEEAERVAGAALELGLEIGEPDALPIYAGQFYVLRSFAGRYAELLPLIEDAMKSSPDLLTYRLAYAIVCLEVDREDEARDILHRGVEAGFASLRYDQYWMTTVVGHAVVAIELREAEAAEPLYEALAPYAEQVAFNGATSQGPVAAYLGKLASLLGRHELADKHLTDALEVTDTFGWTYHRATTLVALASSHRRRVGSVGPHAEVWLDEALTIGAERELPNLARMVDAVRT